MVAFVFFHFSISLLLSPLVFYLNLVVFFQLFSNLFISVSSSCFSFFLFNFRFWCSLTGLCSVICCSLTGSLLFSHCLFVSSSFCLFVSLSFCLFLFFCLFVFFCPIVLCFFVFFIFCLSFWLLRIGVHRIHSSNHGWLLHNQSSFDWLLVSSSVFLSFCPLPLSSSCSAFDLSGLVFFLLVGSIHRIMVGFFVARHSSNDSLVLLS